MDAPASRDELVLAHLHLADRAAAHWKRGGRFPELEFDDIRQMAVEVLMRCAELYDPTKGPFQNYASNSIRKRLIREVQLRGVVRPPKYDPKKPVHVVYLEDLAASLDVPTDELAMLGASGPHDEQVLDLVALQNLVDGADLSDVQLEILRLRFVEGLNIADTAARMGYVRQNVAQHESKIIRRLNRRTRIARRFREEPTVEFKQCSIVNNATKVRCFTMDTRAIMPANEEPICGTHRLWLSRGYRYESVSGKIYNPGGRVPSVVRNVRTGRKPSSRYVATEETAIATMPSVTSESAMDAVVEMLEKPDVVQSSPSFEQTPPLELQKCGQALVEIGKILDALSGPERFQVLMWVITAHGLL